MVRVCEQLDSTTATVPHKIKTALTRGIVLPAFHRYCQYYYNIPEVKYDGFILSFVEEHFIHRAQNKNSKFCVE